MPKGLSCDHLGQMARLCGRIVAALLLASLTGEAPAARTAPEQVATAATGGCRLSSASSPIDPPTIGPH